MAGFNHGVRAPRSRAPLGAAECHKERDNWYDCLFGGHTGTYYLIACALEQAGLITHGTSIRFPLPTREGQAFLHGLETISWDEIDKASGIAYDGEWAGLVGGEADQDAEIK